MPAHRSKLDKKSGEAAPPGPLGSSMRLKELYRPGNSERLSEIDSQFTVLGVHSAKFDKEKDLEAIQNAVLRYEISHPVVNDGDIYLWRELGINSWPKFAVVSPNGKVIARFLKKEYAKC